jgi:hypothetical protein
MRRLFNVFRTNIFFKDKKTQFVRMQIGILFYNNLNGLVTNNRNDDTFPFFHIVCFQLIDLC